MKNEGEEKSEVGAVPFDSVPDSVKGWATALRPGSLESGWEDLKEKENRCGETVSHQGTEEESA